MLQWVSLKAVCCLYIQPPGLPAIDLRCQVIPADCCYISRSRDLKQSGAVFGHRGSCYDALKANTLLFFSILRPGDAYCTLLPCTDTVVPCECRRKPEESQQAVEQAMQMLAELRRTESSPNVEAEALKRNKGGGGPWMSFTRQRRPPKPRSGKKGGEGGSPTRGRHGSPLATVVSVDANTMADAADSAVGHGQNGAAERHSPHHKGSAAASCTLLIPSAKHSSTHSLFHMLP